MCEIFNNNYVVVHVQTAASDIAVFSNILFIHFKLILESWGSMGLSVFGL